MAENPFPASYITISTGLLDIMLPALQKWLFLPISGRAIAPTAPNATKSIQVTFHEQLPFKTHPFLIKPNQGKSR
jgi:hypothetical protein